MAISVSYSEMQGSPTEGQNRSGAKTATRTLICDWTDRWTLLGEIQDDDYENQSGTFMICTNATSAPLAAANLGSTTIAAYEKAIITATYAIPTFSGDSGGTNVTESIEPWAEFLTVGTDNLKWTDGNGLDVSPDQAPGLLFTGFTYVLTKENLEEVPASILTLQGRVNEVAISPTSEGLDHLVFDAETLLYKPPTIQITRNSSGDILWNVSYRFEYKANYDGTAKRGWNYYWNQKKVGGAGFDKIHDVKAVAQYKQFLLGDFTVI